MMRSRRSGAREGGPCGGDRSFSASRTRWVSSLDTVALYAEPSSGSSSGHDPRESNTEGGIFPAIFGTVMMVFLMSFAVVPFGVLAALYLREYAKEGPMVRMPCASRSTTSPAFPRSSSACSGSASSSTCWAASIDQLFYPEAATDADLRYRRHALGRSLTLALLTVPVVIVADGGGSRGGAARSCARARYALGATKFETTAARRRARRGAGHSHRHDPRHGARRRVRSRR